MLLPQKQFSPSFRQKSYSDFLSATHWLGAAALFIFSVVIGWFSATLGYGLDVYAVILSAVIAISSIVGVFLLTSTSPLKSVYWGMVVFLPLIATVIPPRRLGISLFDAIMVFVFVAMLLRKASNDISHRVRLFLSWHFSFCFIGMVVLAVFSCFPGYSSWILIEVFLIFVFLIFSIENICVENGFEKLVLRLGIVILILTAGVLIDRFAHINLTLGGGNPNQNLLLNGELIRRAAGFFQDPQKSAQFFGCAGAFYFVLLIRGRFPSGLMRLVVIASLVECLLGIVLSGSRASIVAVLLVMVLGMFFLLKISPAVRVLLFCLVLAIGFSVFFLPQSVWQAIVPSHLLARFESSGASLEFRMHVWFDTWDMFANQPLWGIGPGSFREYLQTTNPSSTGYYGIGALAGVEYIPDQPESGYLKILYEGGIIGVLCSLVLVIGTLGVAIRTLRNRLVGEDRKTEVLAALLGLAVFAITFVTLFTLSDEKIAMIFALLLAIIWREGSAAERVSPKTSSHNLHV